MREDQITGHSVLGNRGMIVANILDGYKCSIVSRAQDAWGCRSGNPTMKADNCFQGKGLCPRHDGTPFITG